MSMMIKNTLRHITRRSSVRLALAIAAAVLLVDRGLERIAAQASNPISIENARPGSTGWDVFDIGDSSIQGFATSMSINTGETVDFKIKTDSSNYTIEIYRLGYYGGDGARKIADVPVSAVLPQTQPACLSVA